MDTFHFIRSHGLGNDYLVMDPDTQPLELTPERVKLMQQNGQILQIMAERSDEHRVRIARVNDDAPDMVRVAEPDVRPRLAAVQRPIDAVSP